MDLLLVFHLYGLYVNKVFYFLDKLYIMVYGQYKCYYCIMEYKFCSDFTLKYIKGNASSSCSVHSDNNTLLPTK